MSQTPLEKNNTEHALDFIHGSNNIPEKMRQLLIFALGELDKRKIWIDYLKVNSEKSIDIVIPLCDDMESIDMQFHYYGKTLHVSCGPSTLPGNKKEVLEYLKWLDKHMPRNGMTNREILECGNPDKLLVSKSKI